MAELRPRPSLIDLPGFAEQLGALDHHVAETRSAGVTPAGLNDFLAANDALESTMETQSEYEGPVLFEPIPTNSPASVFETKWVAPAAFFLLVLVGATAAALVFHRQVSLIL